jgi:hypothetical protein
MDPGGWSETTESDRDGFYDLAVSVTAVPVAMRVDPGDASVPGGGVVLECEGPALVWEPGMADDASPCTKVYDWPSNLNGDGGRFDVVVEVDWEVSWTSTGIIADSGTLGTLTTTSEPLRLEVRELQTVISRID